MFKFYDIENDKVIEPALEFETKLQIEPRNILRENLFCVGEGDGFVDLYLYEPRQIIRFTPEFRLKLERQNTTYEKIKIFSADSEFFKNLKLLIELEPCFKIQPKGIDPETLNNLILSSSCQNGFLEVSSFFSPEPTFYEIILTPGAISKVQIIPDETISRIQIYDLDKNICIHSSLLTPNSLTPYSSLSQVSSTSMPAPETPIHTKLFKLILDYLEKNVSSKIARDLPIDRDAIFRQSTSPETLTATFNAIKKIISAIKINREDHRRN